MTFSKFDFDALYEAHFRELVEIATTEFGMPVEAAEHLAEEAVLVAEMTGPRLGSVEPRTWLVAAVRYAARNYNFRTDSARAIVR
jgi:DNA-directed RNA polymerase specialized sigma24 family protein